MKRIIFLLIIISSTSLNSIEAKKLSVEQFVSAATKFDPQAQNIISERLRARFLIDQGLPTSRTLLAVQQEYGLSTTGSGTTSILSAEVSKKITSSGTELSIARSMTDRPDREEEVTELRIEQSLWRDSFGSTTRNREKGLVSERDALELQVAEAYEDYVYDKMSDYIDLQRAMLEKNASERQLEQARKLEKNVLDKFKQNIASNADVARAKVQTLSRKEALLSSISEYEKISARLALIVGEKEEVFISPTNFDLSSMVSDILSGKGNLTPERALRLVELKEDAAKVNLDYQKDNLKPEANLLVGYNIDDSDRFSSRVNREEAVIGLRVEVPFGDTTAKANKDSAILDLTQAKIASNQTRLDLALSLSTTKRDLARTSELVSIGEEKLKLTTTIVNEEEKRYRIGKISLEALIDARDDQASAQVVLLEAKAELTRSVLNWLRLNDQLVVKDSLSILSQ